MLHKTQAIILKTVRYGETSLIVTALTEMFGVQTYIVNGIRSSKKNHGKASLYQPAALLELEAYHHQHKNMQRIKEANWSFLYRNIFSDVIKNGIAVFMVELLLKNCKHPEENPSLFQFCEDAFMHLDEANRAVAANFPLFFSIHLSHFFGFSIDLPTGQLAKSESFYLDLQAGNFVQEEPAHNYYLEKDQSLLIAEILKVGLPADLELIKMNQSMRRALLQKIILFYQLHVPDFTTLKTLQVLQEMEFGK